MRKASNMVCVVLPVILLQFPIPWMHYYLIFLPTWNNIDLRFSNGKKSNFILQDSNLICGECRPLNNVLLITVITQETARKEFIDYMKNGIDSDAAIENIKVR